LSRAKLRFPLFAPFLQIAYERSHNSSNEEEASQTEERDPAHIYHWDETRAFIADFDDAQWLDAGPSTATATFALAAVAWPMANAAATSKTVHYTGNRYNSTAVHVDGFAIGDLDGTRRLELLG
jgi:hypothetical protein